MTRPGGRALPMLFWVCLVVALGVRLAGIDKGLRSDEMGQMQYSSLPVNEIVPAILADDAHPPLSYLVYHGWLALGDGDAWARLLSVLLGAVICVLVYAAGRRRVSDATRLTAMWLVAIAPVSVLISQTVRSYTLAAVTVLAAALILLEIDERRERGSLWLFAAYAGAAILALYTFYFSVLALATFGLYGCWSWRGSRQLLQRWVIANAVAAALFLPWLPSMAGQLQRVSGEVPNVGGFYVAGMYLGGTIRGVTGLFGFDDAFLLDQSVSAVWPRAALFGAGLAVAAGATVLIVTGLRALAAESAQAGRPRFMPLVAVAALAPAVAALAAHQITGLVMTPRYMYTSFVLLAYIAAAAILRIRARAVRFAALAACSVVLLARDAQLYAWTEIDWKGGAAYIAQEYEPGDAVVFIRDSRASRYLPAHILAIDVVPAESVTAAPAVSDPALAARVDGQRRLWVALAGTSYRNGPNALVSEWLPSRGFRPVDEQSFGLLRIVLYQRS